MKKNKRQVLVIEDDENTNRLVTDNLIMSGFSVTSAFSGESGLEIIRKDPPDLVVLDLLLPGIDGWEVCRILRKDDSLAKIPILLISVLARDEHGSKAMGIINFLNKPFNLDDLVGEVQKMLVKNG